MDADLLKSLLQSAFQAIIDNNDISLRNIVEYLVEFELPVESLDLIFRSLVAKILSVEKSYRFMIEIILDSWEKFFPNCHLCKKIALTYLLNFNEINHQKLISLFPEITAKDHFYNLIRQTSKNLTDIARRIIALYPADDYKLYKELKEESLKVDQMILVGYFSTLMRATAPEAKTPSWIIIPEERKINMDDVFASVSLVINKDGILTSVSIDIKNIKPIPPEIKIPNISWDLPNFEKVSELISQRLLALTFPSLRKEVVKFLGDPDEYFPIGLPAADELTLFQFVGPLNPQVNNSGKVRIWENPEHYCQKFGGCRMFLCNCYDSKWWTKHCQNCQCKMKGRWTTVRFPMPQGGWDGNFCSFECAHEYLKKYYVCDGKDKKCIEIGLKFIEGQINKFGIRIGKFKLG